MERYAPGVVLVRIKEWISEVFPMMPITPEDKLDPKRDAVIYLISIGRLGEQALSGVVDVSPKDSVAVRVGSVMLGAYREILMAEYDIAESQLLSPEEVKNLAKELVTGKTQH